MRPWILPLLCLLPAIVLAESLADVARKTAEKRKPAAQTEKAPKVYGSDDLDSARERRQTESGRPADADRDDTTQAGKPGSDPQPSSTADSDRQLEREQEQREKDEAMWRERVARATQRLEATRSHYESIKDMTVYPGDVVVDANNRVVASNGAEFRKKVEEAKAEYEAAQQAYEDLMEAARREGVPPGWLR